MHRKIKTILIAHRSTHELRGIHRAFWTWKIWHRKFLIPHNSFVFSGFVLPVRTKCAAGKAISCLGSERQCKMHRRFSILCINCVACSIQCSSFLPLLLLFALMILWLPRYQNIARTCCGIYCHKFIFIPSVTTHLYLRRGLLRINRRCHRWELLYLCLLVYRHNDLCFCTQSCFLVSHRSLGSALGLYVLFYSCILFELNMHPLACCRSLHVDCSSFAPSPGFWRICARFEMHAFFDACVSVWLNKSLCLQIWNVWIMRLDTARCVRCQVFVLGRGHSGEPCPIFAQFG